jgi:hypothetical protein
MTADHEALRALNQRYSRAVDDRDTATLERLFRPDAVITGVRGEQTFAEWIETIRGPRTFPVSMHVLGEPLVELEPTEGDDPATAARLDTYAVVYQIGGEGQSDMTLGIRYHDDVERTDAGDWLIARRDVKMLWMR